MIELFSDKVYYILLFMAILNCCKHILNILKIIREEEVPNTYELENPQLIVLGPLNLLYHYNNNNWHMIQEKFNKLKPYLKGLKYADNYNIVETNLRLSWKVVESENIEFQKKKMDKNENFLLLYVLF